MSALEIEILGDQPASVTASEVLRWCGQALAQAGLADGHVALTFVDEDHIRDLNRRYRQLDEPTDVLSFAIDENRPAAGPRELGDIFVCPAHTQDIREAVVHGALHLAGMDHETDGGEMLALQARILKAQ